MLGVDAVAAFNAVSIVDSYGNVVSMTTTVEGRERYGVVVRYPRELRDTPQAIA